MPFLGELHEEARTLIQKPYFRTIIPRFVRRLINAAFESARARRDMICLKKKIPQLQAFCELADESRQKLQSYYQDYTSRLSPDHWAISLELSVFLMVMCRILKPRNILDLGSGFSSCLFRLYASNLSTKPAVCSVDDSVEWLEKTRTFLAEHDLPAENLITWSSFMKQEWASFDLILHDLGDKELRMETLPKVLTLARPGGIIVLDDAHREFYRLRAERLLNESHLTCYSLRFFTTDKYGRYSMLVTP